METRRFNLIFKSIILLTLLTLPLRSSGQAIDTTIVKTTAVDKSDVIYISSSIGDIDVKTWDKKEVKVEYVISAAAKTVAELNAFSKRLIHDIGEQQKPASAGKISVAFPFRNINRNNRSVELTFREDDERFRLQDLKCSLIVYIPKANSINVKSNFNKLTIDNLEADVKIDAGSVRMTMGDCKNLDLEANFSNNMKIGNVENAKMNLNSCELEMGAIRNNLDLKSSFSHFDIEKIGNEAIVSLNSCSFVSTDLKSLDLKGSFIRNFKVNNIEKAKINLNSSEFEAGRINSLEADKLAFTTFKLGEVGNLNIGNSSSSTFTIEKAGVVEAGSSSFTKFTLNTLSKSFKSKSNSGNVQINNILSGFDEIDINGTFVTIGINAAEGAEFQLSADMTFPNYNFNNILYQNHIKDMSHEVISGRRGNNKEALSKINLNCQSCRISID
jgi:hypothetical protein